MKFNRQLPNWIGLLAFLPFCILFAPLLKQVFLALPEGRAGVVHAIQDYSTRASKPFPEICGEQGVPKPRGCYRVLPSEAEAHANAVAQADIHTWLHVGTAVFAFMVIMFCAQFLIERLIKRLRSN